MVVSPIQQRITLLYLTNSVDGSSLSVVTSLFIVSIARYLGWWCWFGGGSLRPTSTGKFSLPVTDGGSQARSGCGTDLVDFQSPAVGPRYCCY